MFNRVLLFGDAFGIPQLMGVMQEHYIKGVVVSSIRPQYIAELKSLCQQKKIPLFVQPKYNSEDYVLFVEEIKKNNFDLLFCYCYSMIVRKEILELVNFNAINIHWSLLPLNKGPNPTQWAIIKGEKKTGITIHYMDESLDTGDIIAQKEEAIFETDTWYTVNERLKIESIKLLQQQVPAILNGTNSREKQNETTGSVNERLTPDFPLIDFSKMNTIQIFNLIRAQVKPLGGAYILENQKRLHIDRYMSIDEVSALRKKYCA